MRDVTLYSMKNKFVHNCQFVHHAKFYCNMTTLNKLFKVEFDRGGGGGGLEKSRLCYISFSKLILKGGGGLEKSRLFTIPNFIEL